MKLIDVAKNFPPFDKPAGEAAYLISTKQVCKVRDSLQRSSA